MSEAEKPRTFWLSKPDLDFDLNWKQIWAAEYPHKNTLVDCIKVIDYQAYEAIKAERDKLKQDLEITTRLWKSTQEAALEFSKDLKENIKLREQNQWMKDALQIVCGHSNCYCDECKNISKAYWTPKVSLEGDKNG